MLYHPVTPRRSTFEPRLKEGFCLRHNGGGVYKVLGAEKVLRTKHVRAFEDQFPGTRRLRLTESEEQADLSDSSESSTKVYGSLSSSSAGDEENDKEPEDDEDDLVTYVPPVPSRFGESYEEAEEPGEKGSGGDEDDEDDELVDAHGNEDGDDDGEVLDQPVSSRLRRQPRVHYSAAALPAAISTDDEPTCILASTPTQCRFSSTSLI